jgi:hypothetical protein
MTEEPDEPAFAWGSRLEMLEDVARATHSTFFELANSLCIVDGYSEIIESRMGPTAEVSEIRKAAKTMSELIRAHVRLSGQGHLAWPRPILNEDV